MQHNPYHFHDKIKYDSLIHPEEPSFHRPRSPPLNMQLKN
uniref:Uncharacterized protein n=1 Tax=Arundo donax TaxID=35708 RepID=A0A0A8XRV3_ARUDO